MTDKNYKKITALFLILRLKIAKNNLITIHLFAAKQFLLRFCATNV